MRYRKLVFCDLLALMAIEETPGISLYHLRRTVNEFIQHHDLGSDYATWMKSPQEKLVVERLRLAGLLYDIADLRANLARSRELWERIGCDWREFPVSIPIVDGKLCFEQMRKRHDRNWSDTGGYGEARLSVPAPRA